MPSFVFHDAPRHFFRLLILSIAGIFLAIPAIAGTLMSPDGRTRSYEMFIPQKIHGRAAPTLFVLHGGGGSARQVHKSWSLDKLARRHGFVVVYPDGVSRHWNDGRTGGKTRLFKGQAPDDVVFLRALADKLVAKGVARAGQIYMAGVSNGGMMTQRMACEANETFAGFASIIAGLPVSLRQCRLVQPRSVLMINGDADPLMPWQGGGVGFRGTRGNVLSGPDTFAHWRHRAGCNGPVRSVPMQNKNKTDHSYPERMVASACPPGLAVEMIRIHGGGHGIPGVHYKRKRLRKRLGSINLDFDAKVMILDFLGLGG